MLLLFFAVISSGVKRKARRDHAASIGSRDPDTDTSQCRGKIIPVRFYHSHSSHTFFRFRLPLRMFRMFKMRRAHKILSLKSQSLNQLNRMLTSTCNQLLGLPKLRMTSISSLITDHQLYL